VNYRVIYSNRESAASSVPHPGCFEGVFSLRPFRRCREPGDRSMASSHAGANSRHQAAGFARWRAVSTIRTHAGAVVKVPQRISSTIEAPR